MRPSWTIAMSCFVATPAIHAAADETWAVNTELRERYEQVHRPAFGLRAIERDDYLLTRAAVQVSGSLARGISALAQLAYLAVDGKQRALVAPPDEGGIDLRQLWLQWANDSVGWRVRWGRQEMALGSQRLVSLRAGANARLRHEGLHVQHMGMDHRVELFALRPVQDLRGSFDDRLDPQRSLVGVYLAMPTAAEPQNSIDGYVLQSVRRLSGFDGPNSPTVRAERISWGLRWAAKTASWDADIEATVQTGRAGIRRIRAGSITGEAGYRWPALAGQPRLSLRAGIASGDRNPRDDTLRTFDGLYPSAVYFNAAGLNGPANVWGWQPALSLDLAPGWRLALQTTRLHKQRREDAVYAASGAAYAGTAGTASSDIGWQHQAVLEWTPQGSQWSFKLEAVHAQAGAALRQAGGRHSGLLGVQAHYRH
jgi:Alginate export